MYENTLVWKYLLMRLRVKGHVSNSISSDLEKLQTRIYVATNEASGAKCKQLVNMGKDDKGILIFETCLKFEIIKISPKKETE